MPDSPADTGVSHAPEKLRSPLSTRSCRHPRFHDFREHLAWAARSLDEGAR